MDQNNNTLQMIIEELKKQTLFLDKLSKNSFNTNDSEGKFATVKQAAKLFNCSSSTIRRWIKERKINAFKPNNGNQQDHYLIPKEEIENLILKSGGKIMKF